MFLPLGASSVSAALIPYYRMNSFILLSDAVIYCEELDIQYREIQHQNWTEESTVVKCRVIKTFKGEFIEGTVVDVDYQSCFRRHLVGEGEKYQMDSTGKTVLKSPAKYIPAGRALVFLRKRKENFTDSYQPVTAKLVQSNKVLQFGQFQGNPGPLVLAEQKPENISLAAGQSYGEIEFLKDVEIALEKSRVLKKPVQINTRDAFK
jgi:hypothetical protein